MAVVYTHMKKDSREIYYVGIGKDRSRAYHKGARSEIWSRYYNKYGLIVDILCEDIQLEAGAATAFERRRLDIDFRSCQRYYYRIQPTATGDVLCHGQVVAAGSSRGFVKFPVTMRTKPTAVLQGGTPAFYGVWDSSGAVASCTANPAFNSATTEAAIVNFTVAAAGAAGDAAMMTGSVSGYLAFDVELTT